MALEHNDLIAWQRLAQYRNLDEFRGPKPLLAPEISRCFSQVVHEGQRLPYGAVVARDSEPGDAGRLVNLEDPGQLDRAADGANTVVYCSKGNSRRLLRLAQPLESQDSCGALAARVDGVVVRVDASGMVWVVSADFVTTIDDRGGRTRPATDRILGELSQLVVTADAAVLQSLTELAYSHFSPRKIGATFLYSLTDVDDRTRQTPGEAIGALGLNVLARAEWPLIEHQLRHTDGAAVIDRAGRLIRRGVMLEATQNAQNISTEGGARHNSACRHTYDRSDLLALVVSADGPVTVFSDGMRSTSLILSDREMPWNPSGGEMWTTEQQCPNCGSSLKIRKIILYGFRGDEEDYCPICETEAATVHGWLVEIGLIKDNPTIDRIRDYRQRQKAGGPP